MKLLSVQVGTPRDVLYRGRTTQTGIYKEPVEGHIAVTTLGLAGDHQVDKRYHGGPDKAVYAYASEHYDFWREELERDDLEFGAFGENLTLSGLTDDQVSIGDVLRIGGVLLQVTQPRVPCFKLGIRFGDGGMVKKFHRAAKTGFYLRVLQEGSLRAGDDVTVAQKAENSLSIPEIFYIMHATPIDRIATSKAAALPGLSSSWREELRQRLE